MGGITGYDAVVAGRLLLTVLVVCECRIAELCDAYVLAILLRWLEDCETWRHWERSFV
jgi:hypothetical protein